MSAAADQGGAGLPGDPVDRILLREAATLPPVPADRIAVVDDRSGALTLGLSALARPCSGAGASSAGVRVHCDRLSEETRVRAAAEADGSGVRVLDELGPALLDGARWVVVRLPKSLAALDELAGAVARYADQDVRLLAGGRVKHMTRGMNEVLLHHFTTVAASLGQQKSRVLRAAEPRSGSTVDYPRCEPHKELQLTVCAHGAVFAGSGVDRGTRFLASFVPRLDPAARHVVDLGCGTGVLAALAARQLPGAEVEAVDESAAACRSARATMAGNDLAGRVAVFRRDVLAGVRPGSVDVVLCNPPFHRGTARDSDVAFRMFSETRRVLRPGGELWTVFNAHLPYLPALRQTVGSTTVQGQNPQFLVTRSRTPGR